MCTTYYTEGVPGIPNIESIQYYHLKQKNNLCDKWVPYVFIIASDEHTDLQYCIKGYILICEAIIDTIQNTKNVTLRSLVGDSNKEHIFKSISFMYSNAIQFNNKELKQVCKNMLSIAFVGKVPNGFNSFKEFEKLRLRPVKDTHKPQPKPIDESYCIIS